MGKRFIFLYIVVSSYLCGVYAALPIEDGVYSISCQQPFVYYTGSAWSLYDVPTHAIWQETLRHEARILSNGLQLVEH